jgi:hypothetical protein
VRKGGETGRRGVELHGWVKEGWAHGQVFTYHVHLLAAAILGYPGGYDDRGLGHCMKSYHTWRVEEILDSIRSDHFRVGEDECSLTKGVVIQ